MATAIINGVVVTGSPEELLLMINSNTTVVATGSGTKPENPHMFRGISKEVDTVIDEIEGKTKPENGE